MLVGGIINEHGKNVASGEDGQVSRANHGTKSVQGSNLVELKSGSNGSERKSSTTNISNKGLELCPANNKGLTQEQQNLYNRLAEEIYSQCSITETLEKVSQENLLGIFTAADIREKLPDGEEQTLTPLAFAIYLNKQKGIKALLDAAQENNILKDVLSTANIHLKFLDGEEQTLTPFACAIGCGNQKGIKVILDVAQENNILKDVLTTANIHLKFLDGEEHTLTLLAYAIILNNRELAKILITYEVKLKDSVGEKPDCLVQPDSDLQRKLSKYWNKCLDEVKRMREKGSVQNIPFYDILVSKEANELASYVLNEKVAKAFEEVSYKDDFPIYANNLKRQFKIGNQRLSALNDGEKIICERLWNYMSLKKEKEQQPHPCDMSFDSKCVIPSNREIAKYLSNEDIKNLIKAMPTRPTNKDGYKLRESSAEAPKSQKDDVDEAAENGEKGIKRKVSFEEVEGSNRHLAASNFVESSSSMSDISET